MLKTSASDDPNIRALDFAWRTSFVEGLFRFLLLQDDRSALFNIMDTSRSHRIRIVHRRATGGARVVEALIIGSLSFIKVSP